ncbi:hypothetical protein C8Q74DRAFT_1370767 [Fomes fomentarius]|nr:hypothetical protein C8Q74DRAFT_1370767 [Fomes fomentarius]
MPELKNSLSCSLFNQVGFAIDISQYIVWAAFAALRALALSRYKLLSAFIFILSLMPVGINFAKYGFQYEGDVVDIFNFKGCSGLDFVPDALQRKTSLIAADVILVLITWYTLPVKTIFKPNPSRVVGGNQRSSIASTLLQNGTRYFLVLITLNTLHLVFTIAQVFEIAAGGNFSQLTIFTEPATSILVSRFLFNLQEASRETCDQVESDDVTGSSVVFGNGSSSTIDRVLGSIGSSLISTGSVDGRQDESDAIQAEETGPDGGSQRLETATN